MHKNAGPISQAITSPTKVLSLAMLPSYYVPLNYHDLGDLCQPRSLQRDTSGHGPNFLLKVWAQNGHCHFRKLTSVYICSSAYSPNPLFVRVPSGKLTQLLNLTIFNG